MLLLLYQSLRALTKNSLDNRLVRRIFELKMLVVNGEYPNMFQCMGCKKEEGLNGFSRMMHGMLCGECRSRDRVELSESAVYAMQYIVSAEIGKLYTFSVSEEVLTEVEMVMNRLMEGYVDRKFRSLELLGML